MPDPDRAALLALLARRPLPVPVDPLPADITGLRRFDTVPPSVRPALEVLAKSGRMPWAAGFTPDVRLEPAPPHDPNAMGWRPFRGDVVHVNREHPFVSELLKQPAFAPLLGSIVYHEGEHMRGANESTARERQIAWLQEQHDPTAAKFADLLRG